MFCGVAASEPMQSELQVLDAETLQVHVKLRQMYCFLENFEAACHRSVGLAWKIFATVNTPPSNTGEHASAGGNVASS